MIRKIFSAGLLALLSITVSAKTIQYIVNDNLVSLEIDNYDQLDEEGKIIVDALEELIKDAVAGDAESQCELGYLYETGTLVSQDYDTALYWYEKSAAQGYALAINNIGNAYEKGLGVPDFSLVAYGLYYGRDNACIK